MTVPTGSTYVSSPSASYTLSPNYKAPVVGGKTYVAPSTSYLKDKDGNIVYDKNGLPTLVSTPAEGMAGVTGQNTKGKSQTEFDGETFLKLLVTQLKYQDPSKPADSSQIMQQTATLTMTEQINNMVKTNENTQKTYTSMLAEQRIASSVVLVGRDVEYTPDPNDPTKTATGHVDSVKFDGTGPILIVGGKNVPYQNVTQVLAAAAGSPSPAPGPATA